MADPRPAPTVRPCEGSRSRARGFTLVESMVIIALIAALIGILVPALGILRRNSRLVSSQSNMRTVGSLMSAYSSDNRDHVLPSQFNYSTGGAGLVRTASPAGTRPPTGSLRKGSWADILWTTSQFGPVLPTLIKESPSPTWDYRYDSPDYWAYLMDGAVSRNPLRSAEELGKAMPYDLAELPRPFGKGATIREQAQPGYFAANDFFNANPDAGGRWYTNAMIRLPVNSLYLVDSRAGETIPLPSQASVQGLEGGAAANTNAWTTASPDCEVEFRYVGDLCCMLYLDAHVATMSKWVDANDLRNNRQTRVERLDSKN